MANFDIDSERRCAYSGCGRIFSGRADKVFCSDQCRNAAGRQKRRKEKWNEPECFDYINRMLKRNHWILKQHCEGDLAEVNKWLLLDRGFNFKFMTGLADSKDGTVFKVCYDYGWTDGDEGKILIFKLPWIVNDGWYGSFK